MAVVGFDEFVTSRYAALRRTAFLLCGDRQHAEDLVQITLARLFRSWDRAGAATDVDAYARRVLVNVSSSWWRRRWHGERPTASLPERVESDAVGTAELRVAVLAALGRLPARQREVVVLRYLDDLSERDTAEALGVSVGTVKSRTARALAALRADGLLDPQRDAEPEGRR